MKQNLTLTSQTSMERKRTIGRFHYSKQTERTLFFILTMAMLVMGLLAKAGLW